MRLEPLPAGLLLALSLAPAAALGLTSDRDQPIRIQADSVVIDERQRVSTYEGRVEFSQGSLHVTAARVEVRRNGEGVEQVVATGTPVTYRQRPDDSREEIRGSAERVDYQATRSIVELTGNARLWRGEDEFSGPRIVYEAQRNLVRAEGQSKGRVSATIQPRKSEQR